YIAGGQEGSWRGYIIGSPIGSWLVGAMPARTPALLGTALFPPALSWGRRRPRRPSPFPSLRGFSPSLNPHHPAPAFALKWGGLLEATGLADPVSSVDTG